jgi:hypothetical protein
MDGVGFCEDDILRQAVVDLVKMAEGLAIAITPVMKFGIGCTRENRKVDFMEVYLGIVGLPLIQVVMNDLASY